MMEVFEKILLNYGGFILICVRNDVKGVGRVLIPVCWPVVMSGDIRDCTCHSTTYAAFERAEFKREVERLKGIITELEEENEFYLQLLERNEIEVNLPKNI